MQRNNVFRIDELSPRFFVLVLMSLFAMQLLASSRAQAAQVSLQIEEKGRILQAKDFDLSKKPGSAAAPKRLVHGNTTKLALELEDPVIACGAFLSPNLKGLVLLTSLNLTDKRSNSTLADLDDPNVLFVDAIDSSSQRSCRLVVKRS